MKDLHKHAYSDQDVGQLTLAQIKELRMRSSKRGSRMSAPTLVRQERVGALPLSYAQERLWFLDQLGLVGPAYNVPLTLRLSGDLVERALERSLTELVRRHESLRTRFGIQGGTPYQVIDPPGLFDLHRVDLGHTASATTREPQLRDCVQREHSHQFDLGEGPLLRAVLVKLDAREHVLLLTMHHIVSDGWSLGVLLRELGALYAAFVRGQQDPLTELAIQYVDYAIWQRQWLQEELSRKHLDYWKERLSGAPPQLQLPTDRPRPAVETFKGAMLQFDLPAKLSEALKELGRREEVTLFMVVLAAYQVLLSRWSGERDILVGTPIAGRKHQAVEELIGFFVNTLVLRTDLSDNLTFRELLARVKEVTLGAYAHQDLPFEKLVTELRPERNLARQPIFQVMLALQNYPEESFELPGLTWTWVESEYRTAHFDLTLYLFEGSDGLCGAFQYATDLFDEVTIGRMAGNFRTLLEGIVTSIDYPISKLPLLAEAEQHQLLVGWNATTAAYPRERCVHDLFADQAVRTPDAVAVMHEQESLTYIELNRRANRLARYLQTKGAGPGQLVGVCVERGVQMVVGLLGILKTGAAYVPLDPNYPGERLQHMLDDAAPRAVLTQHKLKAALPVTQADIVVLDEMGQTLADYSPENFPADESAATGEDTVYVIYTSGSTGRPKGTAMFHRAMVNLIEWHRGSFPANEGKRVLQFAALSFDVAFQETFTTLCTGGTLVLIDEWLRRDAQALMEFLNGERIQRLFVPPLMLQALAESSNSSGVVARSLQDAITAGEQLLISPEIATFFKRLSGGRLHNHYGPTETHVVTSLTLSGDPGDWPALPAIGRPISNTQIYVLDGEGQAVPIGVSGEIYIGGANVARGYVNRPELTTQRFLPNPFDPDPHARLYKTGDVGRWRSDGMLEYLGRNDDQVKIRGYRIELGEIEAQLARHAQMKEVAVVVREDGAGKRLVAYVVPRDGNALRIDDLRAHLKIVLPEHMVPSAFVMLERLPLTPNGKLDRRALPTPDLSAYASQQYEPANGEVEQELASIWQDLLKVERVGRHDNFFELGGHSLLGIKLIAQIAERLHVRPSVIAIFKYPTIGEMAKTIDSLRAARDEPQNSIEFEEGVL